MATGRKTGGRKAGTSNRRSRDVIDKLESLDCDPIEGMTRIAKQAEASGDKALAGQMYKELAQYTAPKRRAIDQTIKSDTTATRADIDALKDQLRVSIGIDEFARLEAEHEQTQYVAGELTEEAKAH